MVSTERSIEPRCTGMCGALATRFALASKIAQEKSSRSLMFTGRGRVLQRHAHLLGDGHEAVVEHFEQHRIGVRADGGALLARRRAREQHVILARDLRAPAFLHDDGLVRLDDERGSWKAVAGRKMLAHEDVRLAPSAGGEEARAALRLRFARGERVFGLLAPLAAAERLDARGLDDEALGGIDETEARQVFALERLAHGGGVRERKIEIEIGVRARIAHVRAGVRRDGVIARPCAASSARACCARVSTVSSSAASPSASSARSMAAVRMADRSARPMP